MITILKQPFDCSFSKNPIVFEVETNMYYKQKQFTPEFQLVFYNTPNDSEYFNFSFINPLTKQVHQININTSATPLGKFEIPSNSYMGGLFLGPDIYMAKVKYIFESSEIWNAFFDFEIIDFTLSGLPGAPITKALKIKAKTASQDLLINFTTNNASAFWWEKKADAIDSETRSRYKLMASIFIEHEYNSNQFELITHQEVFLNQNSKGFIDISSLLNDAIETSWETYPLPFLEALFYKAKNLKRYYVTFFESWYGDNNNATIESSVLNIHWGGVSTNDLMMGNPLTFDYSSKISFLSWYPSGKLLTEKQNDWISWMNRLPSGNFYLKIKLTHNGTEDFFASELIHLDQWQTVVLNTGFDSLQLSQFTTWDNCEKWSIEIINENLEPVSTEVSFYPDRGCIKKTILYFNSFGMPETFNTTNWAKSINISSTIASRSQSFNTSLWMPQNFVFDSKHTIAYKCNTAVLSNEQADKLQPLLNSTISYLEENKKFVPCIIQNNKGELGVFNEFQQILDLEIVMANENDRASFYNNQITIELEKDTDDRKFIVNLNQIKAVTFDDLEVYKDGDLITTYAYNLSEKKYIHPDFYPLQEGIYHAYANISTEDHIYRVYTKFEIKFPELIFDYYEQGEFILNLALKQSQYPNYHFKILWGDGQQGFMTLPLDSLGTAGSINHTFTYEGKKEIRIKRQTFSDVFLLDMGPKINPIDLGVFKNLEKIYYNNTIATKLYFSQINTLKVINISSAILGAEIGYQPNLTSVSIQADVSFTSDALDEIIKELWFYRKLYNSIPGVYLVNLPFSVSSLFNDIKNGTGEYIGEGLNSDYGWNFVII